MVDVLTGATKGTAVVDSWTTTTAASDVVVVVVVGMVTVLKIFLLTGLTREKGIALLLPLATATAGLADGTAAVAGLAAFVLELISTLPVMSFPAAVNLSGFCLERLPVNGLRVVTSAAAGGDAVD